MLHEPANIVRFALEAHLQAHRTRKGEGRTGREALRSTLDISAPALVERLQAPERLAELTHVVEDSGLAPHGTLTRLAEQVGLAERRHWTVGPNWWPGLDRAYGLSSAEPTRLPKPELVLMAAEAFAADHRELLEKPPNSSARRQEQPYRAAAQNLLQELCWLASGPFGVAHEALRLIAHLAPLAPEVVTAFVRSGVVTTQVIRALDRSLRVATWNSTMRQEYLHLLAIPPDRPIYRRTNWIRALRRIYVDDNRQLASGGEPRASFVPQQLIFALTGRRAYTGARVTDRRYALWCLAEVTILDPARWAEAQELASRDPEVALVLDRANEMRRHLRDLPSGDRDAFRFYPSTPWSEPHLAEEGLESLLGEEAVTAKRWRGREHWAWARAPLRRIAIALLRDALFNPDVIRQRSALDAFRAAGPELTESVSLTLGAVLEHLRAHESETEFLRERCLAYLGMLGRASAIPCVETVLRETRGPVLTQAVATAGDLAHLHPGASVGLMAWAKSRVVRQCHDDDMLVAGISAVVASRQDPRDELREALREPSATVQSVLAWADQVLQDPLLPRLRQEPALPTPPGEVEARVTP